MEWERDRDAGSATIEVWGEPQASLEVRSAGGSASGTALGAIALDERGSGRLELPEESVRTRRLAVVPSSSVRLDEIAIWLR